MLGFENEHEEIKYETINRTDIIEIFRNKNNVQKHKLSEFCVRIANLRSRSQYRLKPNVIYSSLSYHQSLGKKSTNVMSKRCVHFNPIRSNKD